MAQHERQRAFWTRQTSGSRVRWAELVTVQRALEAAGTSKRSPARSGPLKVAMVTSRALPYMGGIETHVEEVVPRLVDRGVDVTVLTTDASGELDPIEQREGFLVRRFPAWPSSRDYYFSPALLRALAAGTFDIVHIQGVHNTLPPAVLALARHRRLPTIVTLHTGGSSSALRTAARNAQWRLERPLLLGAAKLIAVCEFEAELFTRLLRVPDREIRVIRNGSEHLPVGARPAEVSGSPLVLSVGRLERYKGHQRVIAAMAVLREGAPQAHLVVVGKGEYEPQLRAQVRALGLEDCVSFASYGAQERDRLGALMRSADVVALLSEYEAHPVAVMEALAEGTDVVVAATSGMRELAAAGLVRSVQSDALPENVADALSTAARERRWRGAPPTLPSWSECAASLHDVYLEVFPCAS